MILQRRLNMSLDVTKPTDEDLISSIPAYIRETRTAVQAIDDNILTAMETVAAPIELSGDATPDISAGNLFWSYNGAVSVTNFLNGYDGQVITIIAGNSNLSFTHNITGISLLDSVNLNLLANEVISFIYTNIDDTDVFAWRQVNYTQSQIIAQIATLSDSLFYLNSNANNNWVDTKDIGTVYADFAALVADSTSKVIYVTTTIIVDANATIPDTTLLIGLPGGSLEPSTNVTLTINCEAEGKLVFGGTGDVVFGSLIQTRARPQWWGAAGDGTADDTIPLQKALDSGAKVTDLGNGAYRISRTAGPNDTWGVTIENNNTVLTGSGATLRRYNTDISGYSTTHPLVFVGVPDSNVAAAVENVRITGDITFVGENVRHASAGSVLHDGRYAIEIKNTKGFTLDNGVTFTGIESGAVHFQRPGEYDYVHSTEYNTTKNYAAQILNCKFLGTAQSEYRSYLHAVTINTVDNFLSAYNYFEHCDVCISGEGTYDEYDDTEDDLFASGTAVGNVKRGGRGWVIKGDRMYNSAEHALYLSGMDMNIDVTIWTDIPAFISNVKIQGRNVTISGSIHSGSSAALEVGMSAADVTSTAALTSLADSSAGIVDISSNSSSMTTYYDHLPQYGSYKPTQNINILGSITLKEASQDAGYGYAVRLYTNASDANFPEGQIRNVNINATIRNHRVGVYIVGNMAKNINISGSVFAAKPFISAAFADTTAMNTYATVMAYRTSTNALREVSFKNNIVDGSTYLFATDTGGGTAVDLPWGITGNTFKHIQNLKTSDFSNITAASLWEGNSAYLFLDGKAATTFTNSSMDQATHSYGAAAADWILSNAETYAKNIIVTSASGAVNAIIASVNFVIGRTYIIYNNCGYTLTFKKEGGTGGTIANGKSALYIASGSGVYEVFEQA